MARELDSYKRAMTLAALSGLKIALGPAFLANDRRWPSRSSWVLGAMGEMVLDKLGVFPSRFRPSLLIPHTLAGAWVARESLREEGVDDPWGIAMGAGVAAAVATFAPILRIAGSKGLGIPDWLLGLVEDAIALKLGSQALDLPLDRVKEIAREAVAEVSDRVMPVLQELGVAGGH